MAISGDQTCLMLYSFSCREVQVPGCGATNGTTYTNPRSTGSSRAAGEIYMEKEKAMEGIQEGGENAEEENLPVLSPLRSGLQGGKSR